MMRMEHLNLVEPKCWPENDIYFKAGVSVLCSSLQAHGIDNRKYLFLHLNGYTLKDFLLDLPFAQDYYIVIICSPHLLPLAYYWKTTVPMIHAVFESTTDIKSIVSMLKIGISTTHKHVPKITSNEVIFLRHFLVTGNMTIIQNRLSRSYSTVHHWKSKLASKLSVRKLELLTLRI